MQLTGSHGTLLAGPVSSDKAKKLSTDLIHITNEQKLNYRAVIPSRIPDSDKIPQSRHL
jgi:hypothetical protein